MEPKHLRKLARHLRRCKDALWHGWTLEYLRGLRERHNLEHGGKLSAPTVGETVIIKSDVKNHGRWKMGVVEKVIPGVDGIVRLARVRVGKSEVERPVQHLLPLELSCTRNKMNQRS